MPGRVHQNDAPSLSLASSLAAGATNIPVNQSITGVETPISYVINSGGANEEIVTLTSKNTSTSPSQFEDVVRGCDGTADQSHSSGEVLTHEATARDLVDKRNLHSQIQPPSSRLIAFADFDVPDQTGVDGFQIASGQTLTVQQGGADIVNGSLQPTASRTIITITLPSAFSSFVLKCRQAATTQSIHTGLIYQFQAVNTLWYNNIGKVDLGGNFEGRLEFLEEVSGTVAKNGSAEVNRGTNLGPLYENTILVNRDISPTTYTAGVTLETKRFSHNTTPSDTSSQVGLIGSSGSRFYGFQVIEPLS